MITALLLAAVVAPQSDDPIDAKIAGLVAKVDAAKLEQTVRDLAGFGTRHVLSPTEDPKRGTGAARNYLEAQMRAIADTTGGRMTVTRHEASVPARRLRRNSLPLVNIVATLRGTSDPDRVYVVGGHYDSRNGRGADGVGDAPGANDDGSGTAVAVEVCRVLASTEFAATIVFVCYDGEEQGLLGSDAHAETLAESDVLIDGMITNDIVGNTLGMDGVRRDDYLRCFSYSARGNDSVGRSFARAATRAGRHVDGLRARLVFRGDRYGRGGDHRPFASRGVPAIRLTEPREDYSRQHQNVTERDGKPYADLPDFMDFRYLARVAQLNVSLLAELASAPRCPGRVRARGASQSYDTILQWQSGDAPAYEVVWRDTTAPDWEHAKLLAADDVETRGGVSKTTLIGVCLDDVVVGLRAVAADGSRSRVRTPPEPDAFALRPERGGRGR